ncbi:asparaginase, putative [Trypanosoma cruzi]|uniref:asparaginase n=1 Tax=Trypanosoma cruzi (strain CL Brener) TaxID=353153 RepID=Q4DZN4_TRYCC|nr:asparaginase, putative [Trypanosoma cruzi]EAN97982.1 asparaginase, putative [Trypanosoma cruzi]|eukprot:XP_819833.1 asparaginase [Trypanosoma cruzi strain CL Brener]
MCTRTFFFFSSQCHLLPKEATMYLWGHNSLTLKDSADPSLEMGPDTEGEEVLLINARPYTLTGVSAEKGGLSQGFIDIKKNEDLQKAGVPPFRVMELDVLRYSADQNHDDWVSLAALIRENYHKYRGFVINNGKDNMVATATALSFMLENLGRPVIFTGSCIPPERLYTDLYRNLIVALLFASCSQINEVCILFEERLFRANRTIQFSRSAISPFDSPHFPPLATIHGKMSIHRTFLRPYPHGQFRVMDNMRAVVLCLKLGPSMRRRVLLRSVELTEARAIVIIAYGGGNAPTRGGYMKEIVRKAVERDIAVCVCTQNLYGSVDLGTYAAGDQLLEVGAVSSRDMTIEATIMKLKYLIGVGLSTKEIKRFFGDVSLRGELTPPTSQL